MEKEKDVAVELGRDAAGGLGAKKYKQLVYIVAFTAALAGLLVVILRGFVAEFPVDDEQLVGFVVVIASYILGTTIEDAGRGDYLTVLPKSESSDEHSAQ